MRIYILGLPKSGTSILASWVSRSQPGWRRRLFIEPGERQGAEDTDLHQRIRRRHRNVVTKNLLFPDRRTDWERVLESARQYDRRIWLARDPRDNILSIFFYHWYRGHSTDEERFREAWRLTREKERSPASIPFYEIAGVTMNGNVAEFADWQGLWYSLLAASVPRISATMHVSRYESVVDRELQALGEYLGFRVRTGSRLGDDTRRVERTGQHGNWRRWFNRDDVEFFRPLFTDYMTAMGYDTDDWTLMPCETLPPSEGTEYMTRLHYG